MQPIITTPLSLLISLSVLSGWFISDFRFNDVVNVAVEASKNSVYSAIKDIEMLPAATSPDIATNWFSGSTANMSTQLPAAQARNDEKNKHIAQGRILGESYGSDGDV